MGKVLVACEESQAITKELRLVCLIDAIYGLNKQRQILEGDKDESKRDDGVSNQGQDSQNNMENQS